MRPFEYARAATVEEAVTPRPPAGPESPRTPTPYPASWRGGASPGGDRAGNGADRAAGTGDGHATLAGHDAPRFLAGGTDLLTLMKADVVAPSLLVDIERTDGLPRGIQENKDGLVLGALTTLSEIERHPGIAERYRALAEAVSLAATPQLRNMATIGGNLLQRPRCWYFRSSLFHC
jgi:CO/xanthine dehydrogenase FAD-binding subunit